MKLVIDKGNSICKLAVYGTQGQVYATSVSELTRELLEELWYNYRLEATIYSSVGSQDDGLIAYLRAQSRYFCLLQASTPVPIEVRYAREQLGGDRLACACGAYRLLGSEASALLIDAGTALTYERLEAGCYLGGNISLGLWMRFKALAQFTKRLPLVESLEQESYLAWGQDSRSAIELGVLRGLVEEVRAYIVGAKLQTSELEPQKAMQILLTGGDAPLLHRHLAMPSLRLVPDLVLLGLVEILEYNIRIKKCR